MVEPTRTRSGPALAVRSPAPETEDGAAQPIVLVVDDESAIRRLVKLELSARGYHVMTAANGLEAMSLAERYRPDVAILDVVMPDMSGLELLVSLRERMDFPILLLTGNGNDAHKVGGLDLGADDYVVKPFNPNELAARVGALLRRSSHGARQAGVVKAGDLEIDLAHRLVKKGGTVVPLTRTEWILLQQLALNADTLMLHAELLSNVWGSAYVDDLQYLRVWMARLRAKLETDPHKPTLIVTLPGIGYRLVPHPELEQRDAPVAVGSATGA